MARYPGRQNMLSIARTPAEVVQLLADAARVRGATAADVRVGDMVYDERIPIGPMMTEGTHYQCHWYTYLGWKTYMLLTGCLASDPAEEDRLLPMVCEG